MEEIVLGIDCGGTHTDAALLAVDVDKGTARLLSSAKTATRHDDLPVSVAEVLQVLKKAAGDNAQMLKRVERVTLGTTLEVNALVQDKADKVGLALSAGPGLDPVHFVLGENICIVPGGLDHRGVEVEKLFLDELERESAAWPKKGVAAVACVGKFSPRNPAHENTMARIVEKYCELPVTLGHKLSGRLNFPRRIATAYYNAAVGRLHQNFLDAMEGSFRDAGINGSYRLLKADGGAIPFAVSRREPVQSILSGPAASVMGVLALWKNAAHGCSLLLDMGGTTTDIAMFYNGSPVIDREGMLLRGRRTLVKSLASISIGVGGDSLVGFEHDASGAIKVWAGPLREGPAMAFGGSCPTLLDALNTLDDPKPGVDRGNMEASREGIAQIAARSGMESRQFAQMAVDNAMDKIARAAYDLVENINSRPIYTLAALKAVRQARPERACLVGGPSQCLCERVSTALGLPVEIAPYSQVANAIGAALTIPTASLETYADTGKGIFSAPALNYDEKIGKNFSLQEAKQKALELLQLQLQAEGIGDAPVEVVEADLFATLDDYGRGSKDMRVACQIRPGIVASVA